MLRGTKKFCGWNWSLKNSAEGGSVLRTLLHGQNSLPVWIQGHAASWVSSPVFQLRGGDQDWGGGLPPLAPQPGQQCSALAPPAQQGTGGEWCWRGILLSLCLVGPMECLVWPLRVPLLEPVSYFSTYIARKSLNIHTDESKWLGQ